MSRKQQELSPHVSLEQQRQAGRDFTKRFNERAVSKIIDWERIADYQYIRELAERTGLSIGQVNKAIESLNKKRNPRKVRRPEEGKGKK